MRDIFDPQALRKKLTFFYLKFCNFLLIVDGGLLVYLVLVYFFLYDEWLIILQNIIIIPQIIYNARVGNNPGFSIAYVIGYLGVRLLIPLYERTCTSNHFMLTPMVPLAIIIAVLYLIQVFY